MSTLHHIIHNPNCLNETPRAKCLHESVLLLFIEQISSSNDLNCQPARIRINIPFHEMQSSIVLYQIDLFVCRMLHFYQSVNPNVKETANNLARQDCRIQCATKRKCIILCQKNFKQSQSTQYIDIIGCISLSTSTPRKETTTNYVIQFQYSNQSTSKTMT